MAQPDLISQKLLGTDPRIGFGEAGVSSNQVPPLDMRGFQYQAEINDQKAKAQAAKQKADQERIDKFDWVDVDGKHTPQYEKAKGQFNAVAAHMLNTGNVDIEKLSQMNAEINAFAETGDNEHKAYLNDLDKTIPDYSSAFGKNEYNQGEATKLGNVSYNATPIGAYTGTTQRVNKYGQVETVSVYDPKANPDLYNIEAAADNFTNNYKQLGLNQFSNRTDLESGSMTTVVENIKNGIYMKEGKDGKWTPGVSDDVLNNYVQYGAVHDYYANKTLPQIYDAHANYIKANPELYPQYAGLEKDQIYQDIRENGDPLTKGNLRQDDLIKELARKDLESRNKQSIEKTYEVSEDEERVEGGIGQNDSIGTAVQHNENKNFVVRGMTFTNPTGSVPGSGAAKDANTKRPIVAQGWVPSTVYLQQSKLKPIVITPQSVTNVETNGLFADLLNDKQLTSRFASGLQFKPADVSLLPVDANGKVIIGSEAQVRKTSGVQYVPYVTGTVTVDMSDIDKNSPEYKNAVQAKEDAGDDVKEISKNVYQYTVRVPYTQVNKQMEANYGITQQQIDTRLYNPALNLKNLNTTTPAIVPATW